jgi:flagella basal body P-ring formation protein FlgA
VRTTTLALLVTLGTLAAPASAETQHSLEDIRAQVAAFLERETPGNDLSQRVTVTELDPRLRLHPCASPLAMEVTGENPKSGSVTVRVRCPGPRPWSLFVPARQSLLGTVVVLARPVQPGTPLQASDLRLEQREVGSLGGGFFSAPDGVLGRTLRRPVAAGQPLVASALAAVSRVRRGDRVVLVARLAGVEVRMQGEALRDGSVGESIPVRNLSSERLVEGRVTADGSVEVPL